MNATDELAKMNERVLVTVNISGSHDHADRQKILAVLRMLDMVATLRPQEFVTGRADDTERGWAVALWAYPEDARAFLDSLHDHLGPGRCALVFLPDGRAVCSRVLVCNMDILERQVR